MPLLTRYILVQPCLLRLADSGRRSGAGGGRLVVPAWNYFSAFGFMRTEQCVTLQLFALAPDVPLLLRSTSVGGCAVYFAPPTSFAYIGGRTFAGPRAGYAFCNGERCGEHGDGFMHGGRHLCVCNGVMTAGFMLTYRGWTRWVCTFCRTHVLPHTTPLHYKML